MDKVQLWSKQFSLIKQLTENTRKMTTLIPSSQPTGVEAYEDMFKEITRKLYGEETGHGLHTLGTPVATHVATSGPPAPEGERSFTTLISDRSLATIDYDHVGSDTTNLFKSDDHLTTAFGLAALMQNGFPPPGAILNPHNFVTNKPNSIITSTASGGGTTIPPTAADDKWPSTDDCLPWTTNKTNFNVPQKIFKVKKQEHVDHDSSVQQQTGIQSNNTVSKPQSNVSLNTSHQTNSGLKRYNCTSCPYSTDRRDLFTRHENIHKEEKPFHCYVCLKQFNRADHVKKHFLRMHRGLAYDLSRTKRSTTNARKSSNFFPQQPKQEPNQQGYQQATTLTIPTNTYQTQAQQQQPNQGQQQQQQQQQQPNTNHNDNGNMNNSHLSNQNPGASQIVPQPVATLKVEKVDKKPKVKGEKRFVCCYCPWSGTDNWGLKRHLNTHTKPYVCLLCDYKAARSERLSTHVFKVHNKKICGKCNFLADNQEDFQVHINEAHQLQMAALSRNTASVAQDFHNAGGGVKTFTNNHSAEENYRQIIDKYMKQTASSQLSKSVNSPIQTSKWIDYSMAMPNVSPPAINPNIEIKKRRSNNCNKENSENVIPRIADVWSINQRPYDNNCVREQFQNSKKYQINNLEDSAKENLLALHPELEISISQVNNDIDRLEKRNRKQAQPRKIEQIDDTTIINSQPLALNDIRDKHLVRMVSRKKTCFKCKHRNALMISYHTTSSLMLHQLWRHGYEKHMCNLKKCKRNGRRMNHYC